jgi:E3 ubiquitin-protein ligase SHPRH
MKILQDDPNAKCLVFSFWVTMLDLIQDSLRENYIEFRYLKENGSVQKNLLEFKHNENVNVLLIPFNFGANGLNLTEATHVLLVEPILNVSQEIQAIGRVHRIGQTKTTYIHRFLVRDTIEDIIYRLFLGNSNYQRSSSDTDRKTISISDVQNLFLNL